MILKGFLVCQFLQSCFKAVFYRNMTLKNTIFTQKQLVNFTNSKKILPNNIKCEMFKYKNIIKSSFLFIDLFIFTLQYGLNDVHLNTNILSHIRRKYVTIEIL